MMKPEIIISVTGNWESRGELVQEIATRSGGYLLGGKSIYHAQKDIGFEVDVYEHDPTLLKAFSQVGDFCEELLKQIENHTCTVYVTAKVKDCNTVQEVIDVGIGLLEAGGIAIKVETTGFAYSKEEWEVLAENRECLSLYMYFVGMFIDGKHHHSSGMQSFGLPDVIIVTHMELEEAADILREFNLYRLVEEVKLTDGETFSINESSPIYQLSFHEDFRYEQDDIFYNPCGLWELKEVEVGIFNKIKRAIKDRYRKR
jgi:hypothetical protein